MEEHATATDEAEEAGELDEAEKCPDEANEDCLPQDYDEIFRPSEKLDAYAMNLSDMDVFEGSGYRRDDVGKLCTYGCVLHTGVRAMFQGIADRAFAGDLAQVVDGKTFLDLGSAEARCVLSALLHFGPSDGSVPVLRHAVGVELSELRHSLAQRHLARLRSPAAKRRVSLLHDDILGEDAALWIERADVIYASNLHFPLDVSERLGHRLLERMDPRKDVFVMGLAPLGGFAAGDDAASERRTFADTWDVMVPMSWNPGGWPVTVYHFPRVLPA